MYDALRAWQMLPLVGDHTGQCGTGTRIVLLYPAVIDGGDRRYYYCRERAGAEKAHCCTAFE